MEGFKIALDTVIDSMIRLEAEWDRIECTHADQLAEHYPLTHDYREIVYQMMNWQEKL